VEPWFARLAEWAAEHFSLIWKILEEILDGLANGKILVWLSGVSLSYKRGRHQAVVPLVLSNVRGVVATLQ
jgi:hypothetical protein